MKVVGVDAYGRGWVAVVLEGGRFTGATAVRNFGDVLELDADVIGVDIPIGLPPVPPRAADVAARVLLRGKSSSVFPTYPREVVGAADYTAARALCRERGWPVISSQAFRLGPKILEADRLKDDERVVEVHPEASFAALAGAPVAAPKRTWNGLMIRRRLLAATGIELPDVLDEARDVPADDVVDAAAAAWTAARYARGEALPLPEGHRERLGAIWR